MSQSPVSHQQPLSLRHSRCRTAVMRSLHPIPPSLVLGFPIISAHVLAGAPPFLSLAPSQVRSQVPYNNSIHRHSCDVPVRSSVLPEGVSHRSLYSTHTRFCHTVALHIKREVNLLVTHKLIYKHTKKN